MKKEILMPVMKIIPLKKNKGWRVVVKTEIRWAFVQESRLKWKSDKKKEYSLNFMMDDENSEKLREIGVKCKLPEPERKFEDGKHVIINKDKKYMRIGKNDENGGKGLLVLDEKGELFKEKIGNDSVCKVHIVVRPTYEKGKSSYELIGVQLCPDGLIKYEDTEDYNSRIKKEKAEREACVKEAEDMLFKNNVEVI